ncbi:MAG: Na+/H+ antiporter NhaA [Polyangiaceae bacterium]
MILSDFPLSLPPKGSPQNSAPPSAPPESWALARRVAKQVIRPLDRFMHIEAASGVVLLIAAAAALVWANSPWGETYEHFWHTKISLGVGSLQTAQPLHFWINDGLMVIFFFLAGLEIRREIHQGELSELRRAALPAIAAIGGMIMPAVIYAVVARGSAATHGWGVPMATDIAFAVGVLALLGKRVPAALRVLLLALAIIDDIGAIVVIAVFFSSDFSLLGLGIAGVGILMLLGMQRLGIRNALAYAVPVLVMWAGMLKAGVHPTIAGVLAGLLTPVTSWYGQKGFMHVLKRTVRQIRENSKDGEHADEHGLIQPLSELEAARREAVSPVVRLETALHPWVAFGIMPLFALANAGVDLRGVDTGAATAGVISVGVIAGLVIGKPLGVVFASWLSVKLGICSLPRGVDWKGVTVVGLVAGIGFTMAIFVSQLAFDNASDLGVAKLSVLCASVGAAVVTLVGARFLLPKTQSPEIAELSASDCEASTEY